MTCVPIFFLVFKDFITVINEYRIKLELDIEVRLLVDLYFIEILHT